MGTQVNIVNLFNEEVRQQPAKAAIIDKDHSETFAQLSEGVFGHAQYLRKQGLAKGDRVLVFIPVSVQLYKVVLALISIGAVPVFLDQWSSLKRLEQSAELADCKGLIAGFKLRALSYFIPVFRKIPLKLNPYAKTNGRTEVTPVDADDAALITFTTGSSGKPKAAWRSHAFLHEQHKALMKELKPAPDEINMTTLPVFVFSNLAAGLTTVLPDYNPKKPQDLKPDRIFKDLKRCTTLLCSPDFLRRLAAASPGADLPRLRKVFTGGAPVFPRVAVELAKVFPQAVVAYGSTEAEPIASIAVRELAEYHNSGVRGIPAGKLHPDIQLKIMAITDAPVSPSAQQWQKMNLPPNEIGEIVVSGPHVLKKYFNNPEAQARQKFVVEDQLWHRTGDSGYLDEDGRLVLTGPCKYAFRHQGELITQFPVEMKLAQLDSISEGTILSKQGERILFLVKKKGKTLRQVEETLHQASIHFDRIILLKELPKDPRHHSKIEYRKLLTR